MTRAQVWWALLVVGQGVTIALLWLIVRRFIQIAEKLSVMFGLFYHLTNETMVELQRHRWILKFQKPDPPDDEPPTLFI